MRRKNLWLRVSSCTMAALLATTSVAPVSAADFTSDVVVEDQQDAEEEVEAPVIEEESQDAGETDIADETAEAEFEGEDTEACTDSYEADEFMDDVDVFSNGAGEAAAAQNGFGTANTVFAKGTYKVSVTLKKANDLNTDSMAASCIAGMQLLR